METTISLSIDYASIARQLRLDEAQVGATVELLDEGNTVPFITRYRKDRTRGLDEEKIRAIQEAVNHRRQLNERKERILRTIQSQDRLTDELQQQIVQANSLKVLEDLYLPYRPKKQTLATQAKQRGLEPLAMDLLQGKLDDGAAIDVSGRAAELVNADQGLASETDVLTGVKHILAEMYSERPELRALARKLMWAGELQSRKTERVDGDDGGDSDGDDSEGDVEGHTEDSQDEAGAGSNELDMPAAEPPADVAASSTPPDANAAAPGDAAGQPAATAADRPDVTKPGASEAAPSEAALSEAAKDSVETKTADAASPESASDDPAASDAPSADVQDVSPATQDSTNESVTESETKAAPAGGGTIDPRESAMAVVAAKRAAAEERRKQRREARHRKRQKLEQSFKDYFEYSEAVKKLPHYRVLAVNRGERCKVLRVKIQFDVAELKRVAEEQLIPQDHPHRELLAEALQDGIHRLVVPSIEREIRRELTDRAESHAVKVFAQNLRKLLLQAPLRGRRVLAIDPGFRSGCKIAALDEFGQVLGHTLIHVIGAAERVQQSRARLVEQIKQYKISVVAIGNGTACRETEQLVASVIAEELAESDVHYLIVNEAGASVYSTSQIGREELPRFDATVRGAVSIGRRTLDPLSELVKIDPASIGVGLYQHDVKAKHLRTSLDAVVESCVNYVGVDVNSASPALLGYVSGLNQLTARRVYEYRQAHGPFRSREQLKQVPGVGDATFVQAAGFLKISEGDNPLDETWIHPESYTTAERVLDEIGCEVSELSTLLKSRRPAKVPATGTDATPPGDGSGEAASPVESTAGEESASTPPDAPATENATESSGADSSVPKAADSSDASSESTDAPQATAASEASGVDVGELAEASDSSDTASSEPVDTTPPEPSQPVAPAGATSDSPSESAPTQSSHEVSADGKQEATAASKLLEKLNHLDVDRLATQLSVGQLSLRDILASLARPGRDPREDLRPPVFRREILKLEDLKPGMELSGTVLNVVDFGAFVDIGLSDSGLIHVSRLAGRFVADPHEVVSVGDILNVWVVEVDEKRRRVSLTAIPPGSETVTPSRPGRGSEGGGRSGKRSRRPRTGTPSQPSGSQAGKGRGKGRRPTGSTPRPKPKKPKKRVAPITDGMIKGTEPMRTFSDLQQFFARKRDDDGDDKPNPKK